MHYEHNHFNYDAIIVLFLYLLKEELSFLISA